MKTLVIAAVAAVVAAIVTSLFWEKGALVSTALTPVIVTLTQEALRRPAEKISATASRVTVAPVRGAGALVGAGAARAARDRLDPRQLREGEAVATDARNGDGANGVGAPPPPIDDTRSYDPARSAGDAGAEPDTAPAAAAGRPAERKLYGRKRFRWKVVLMTATAAFVVAVGALTIPELVFGGSVTGGDRGTTLFGGEGRSDRSDASDSGEGSSESSGSEGEAAPSGSGSDSAEPAPAPDEEAPTEEPAPEDEPTGEPAPTEEPVAPAPSE